MISEKPELIQDEMSNLIVSTARRLATSDGTANLTVRKILKELDITNRVFYNRFHNIDQVLEIISTETLLDVRKQLKFSFASKEDFFKQAMEQVEKTLIISYTSRSQFTHYVFENDSVSDDNYLWWMSEIKRILEAAISHGFVKNVDIEMTAYAIWCFIRGFNADAIGHKLPLDTAISRFRYGFSIFLDHIKA